MNMEIPTPDRVYSALVNKLTQSIKILLNAGYVEPALIVLYTAIDIFASLQRLKTEPDTRGDYFKKWVKDYMIAGSQRLFTPEDPWGARCGFLHTHSASSKISRQGKARQLHYYKARVPVPPRMQQAFASLAATQAKQFVDVDLLYADFVNGLRRFTDHIQRDAKLKERVAHHCKTIFGHWSSSN